jgi:hypothetical protein
MSEINLNNIQNFSNNLTENTLPLHYNKDQTIRLSAETTAAYFENHPNPINLEGTMMRFFYC